MLRLKKNLKVYNILCFLFLLIMLIFQSGCMRRDTEVQFLKIMLDWSSIKSKPDYPISACHFYMFSEVKLIVGPTEEIVNGEVFNGMEGYENDDIDKPGSCIYKFLIKKTKEHILFSWSRQLQQK